MTKRLLRIKTDVRRALTKLHIDLHELRKHRSRIKPLARLVSAYLAYERTVL